MRCSRATLIRIGLIFLLYSCAAPDVAPLRAGVLRFPVKSKSTNPQTHMVRTVQGKITDREGRPIAGALVVLENRERGFYKEQKSDGDGIYKFASVTAVRNEVFNISVSAETFLTRRGTVIFSGEQMLLLCVLNRDPLPIVKRLLAEGVDLLKAGNFSAAKARYHEVLTYNLASAVAELGLGLCELGMGDMAAAREKMEKAVGLARAVPDPGTETAALEHLGDLMLRQLDLDGALRHYLEALELGFERADFLALKVADTYRLQQKPALALAYYRKALQANPALEKDLEGKMRSLDGVEARAPEEPRAPGPDAAVPAAPAPLPDYDEKLRETLKRSADYCRQLEKAAFRYSCLEDVVEESWPGRAFARKNTFRYDFQIMGGKKRISEKRKLLRENGKKADGASSGQLTIFQSQLKFFAPVQMLAAGNQRYYHYRILREERIAGEPFLLVRIEARRQFSDRGLLEGSVLVSPANGSVLRIDIAQDSIIGIEERRRLAGEEGFEGVIIRDSHWFEKMNAGLRFPSRSEMRELYLKDQMQTLHYTVSYAYSAYKFFSVQISDIEIH